MNWEQIIIGFLIVVPSVLAFKWRHWPKAKKLFAELVKAYTDNSVTPQELEGILSKMEQLLRKM
jgi:hypothetical protein